MDKLIHLIGHCQDECENYEKPRLRMATTDPSVAVQEAAIFHDREHYIQIVVRPVDGPVIEITAETFALMYGVPVEQVRAVWQSLNVIPKDE